ncbi:MAG: undecaprenyl-diphosphatase UppP [Candidatus Nanopelagicales bacterium]|nr:undecaprenyl-diphosphatase UppP [Candidatus Nanopelagicales bacterium]
MLEAIFLGIIQGLTEFIPVSSSAHIRILGEFLPSAQDPGATFTAIMQIGTEIAVLIYFRADIARLISASLKWLTRRGELVGSEKNDARQSALILLGSLPIFLLGYFGQEYIRQNFRSLYLIAATLIIFGLLLGVIDHYGKKMKDLDALGARDGIAYGIAQSLALIPGVSRSGATIAMGRALGYKREAALRYSFFLAIPAVLGSGAFELFNSLSRPLNAFSPGETIVATITAFVIGYLVISWLMKYVQTKSFMPFVIYRVLLGTLLLIFLSTGVITA